MFLITILGSFQETTYIVETPALENPLSVGLLLSTTYA